MHILVYNPVSGNSGNEKKYLTSILEKYELDYRILLTRESSLQSQEMLDLLSSAKTIIVAGGDGTVSEVINHISKFTNQPDLLIYPRGTSNEYASSLGITKKTLIDYMENNTNLKMIDIGRFNKNNIFTYSFAFGNFTHIPYETPQWLKNRFGYAGYWLYGFISMYLLKIKKYEMTFNYNDREISGQFMFGSISNSNTLGRILNLKDVTYDDGMLELVLVKAPRSLKQIVLFLSDTKTGMNKSGLFVQEKISKMNVKSPKFHSWSADGEYSGQFNNIEIEVLNKVLKIIY